MEARVAKLEADVEHIKTDVAELKALARTSADRISDIRVDVAAIRGEIGSLATKVEELPTYSALTKIVLAALAVVTALVMFQSQIQSFVGLRPVAPAASSAPH